MSLAQPLPDHSLLTRYRDVKGYTDSFSLDVPGAVSLAQYVATSDAGAYSLARGETEAFAAWTVEARSEDQILMCDFLKKTRSWLMVEALPGAGTRLWLGSAIVPKRISADGRAWLGLGFHALLPFHKVYSVALLRAAAAMALDRRRKGCNP